MLLKIIINIFCVLVALGYSQLDAEEDGLKYINGIRSDYCLDYCKNKCKKVSTDSQNNKMCISNGDIVITDKYNISLSYRDIIVTWKITPVNLEYLKDLKLSAKKFKTKGLLIRFSGNGEEDTTHRCVDYMKALNIIKARYYNDGTTNEQHIDISRGPSEARLKIKPFSSHFFINYFSVQMPNLKFIELNGNKLIKLDNNIFQNNTQLEGIMFSNLNLENLSTETFEHLANFSMMHILNCTVNMNKFFRISKFQNNLTLLGYDSGQKLDLTLLQSYKQLKSIFVNNQDVDYYAQAISNTNLSTIICNKWGEDCYFNIGTNGKRCPESCSCLINDYQEIFLINCDDQELTSIPELPIPTMKSTVLRFQDNALTELPSISNEGYNNVRELYVANNKITSIRLDQLPQNLTSLDIRNNSITSLDPEVVDFLKKQEITLVQTGINWICNCKNKQLLSYLSNLHNLVDLTIRFTYRLTDNSVHYYHLKGPCPEACSCCINDNQFVINCTMKSLNTFPPIPDQIVGDSSLLLNDNRLEALPTTSLRNSTLGELHLRNISLTHLHLDQLPFDLKVLDIRDNKLTELDEDVTDFISQLPTIQLSGNPWQCDCTFTKFLDYLRRENPNEYKVALRNCNGQGQCPDQCTCCKDSNSLKFISNCSEKNIF